MKGLLWRDGRFAWPFVALVVCATVWLVAFDLAWRLLTMPFWALGAIGAVVGMLGLGLFATVARRARS
jgi:hypothetical protein